MKKIPMMSRIFFVLMLLISGMSTFADQYAYTNDSCCPSICNLFSGGCWGYQIRAGVYPTIWRNRGDIFLNACDCITNAPVVGTNLGGLPKFNKLFKLPWIVGTQFTYAWSDCWELYGELNFIQANSKKRDFNTLTGVNTALAARLGHYRAISGYVGAHYNFWQWCGNSSFFIGAKIGAIYHYNIHIHQVVAPAAVAGCVCSEPFKRVLYKNKARISGGANLGLDYCWCDNWSIVLTGEVVVSGGPRGAACVPLLNAEIIALAGGSNLAVNEIKTEISFPVTVGLKFNF